MSTTGTPQPPAAAQPQTAAEIAAANAASQSTATPGQPPATPPPATPLPAAPAEPTAENPVVTADLGNGRFSVKYFTGETFEGTQAEILGKIGQAHVNTKQWAQNEITKAKQPPPQVTPPPSRFASPAEEDAAKYIALQVARTLGYNTAEEMQAALGHISGTAVEYESQAVSMQFQAAAPDFNPTPQNSNELLKVITETIGDEAFERMGRAQQIRQMQMAHAYCLQTGKYQAKPADSATAQPGRVIVPPAPGGGRGPDTGGQLPAELMVQPGDSAQTIREKWDKAAAAGYVPARGQ